jgi:hypothetical protein
MKLKPSTVMKILTESFFLVTWLFESQHIDMMMTSTRDSSSSHFTTLIHKAMLKASFLILNYFYLPITEVKMEHIYQCQSNYIPLEVSTRWP